jgi:hypothetical protein
MALELVQQISLSALTAALQFFRRDHVGHGAAGIAAREQDGFFR